MTTVKGISSNELIKGNLYQVDSGFNKIKAVWGEGFWEHEQVGAVRRNDPKWECRIPLFSIMMYAGFKSGFTKTAGLDLYKIFLFEDKIVYINSSTMQQLIFFSCY